MKEPVCLHRALRQTHDEAENFNWYNTRFSPEIVPDRIIPEEH